MLNKICSKIVNLFIEILLTISDTVKYCIEFDSESLFSLKLYTNKIYLQYITKKESQTYHQKIK